MLGYIFRRVLYMIPTLFGMSLISFLIISMPYRPRKSARKGSA